MTRKTTNATRSTTARLVTLAALATVTATAGCSSSRFDSNNFAALQPVPAAPAPVQAAPTNPVQTGALPPVNGAQPLPGQPDPNNPAAPQTGAPVEVASADATPQTPVATAPAGPAISENSFIGNWQTSVNGQSCATFFGLTDLGSGLLGGTRGCPGELSKFRTWRVNGNQATLRDASGATVATLTKTGDKQFSGTTAGGQGFTLTR